LLWIGVVAFTIIILFWWGWITQIQFSNLTWQNSDGQKVLEKIRQDWDQNFEKMRNQETTVKKVGEVWGQMIANIATSTTSTASGSATSTNSATGTIYFSTSTVGSATTTTDTIKKIN
jgi:4-amino-4-deoxy-L-arabinose transferase-like glycosyltransferase